MPLDAGPKLLRDWIARAAQRDPEKPWIVCADDGRTVSYSGLHEVTGRIAALLRDRGVAANDRVALLANNSLEHLLCYFGVMAYGATICTVHVEMNRNQLGNIFARLMPSLVLHQDGLELDDLLAGVSAPRMRLGRADKPDPGTFFAEVARHAPNDARTEAGADDDAVILFTSGTSARPKGVVLSYREHLANIDPTADGFGIAADDRVYDFRSFNWASAQLLGALVPVNRGATLVMATKFSASRFFKHVRDHGVTVAAGNPTTINILLNTEGRCTSRQPADAALPHLQLGAAHDRGMATVRRPVRHPHCARATARARQAGSRPFPASSGAWAQSDGRSPITDLAIVDAAGRSLPSGEIGEVEIGGFAGHDYRYLGDDGSVKVNSRGRIRTGDLGLLDADGYLRLTGREKDLIIRGGVNISPVEIDGFLMRRPELIEVATVGVPDATYGEEVVSYVVARPGATIDTGELLRYCSDGLPAFKAPKQIVLSASLPKTERGKLDRKVLVDLWRRETQD